MGDIEERIEIYKIRCFFKLKVWNFCVWIYVYVLYFF